jgi:hypothetical protein
VEEQHRRVRVRIGQKLEPCRFPLAQHARDCGFHRWPDLVLHSGAASSFHLRHPFISLIAACACIGKAQKCRRQRQVKIFGKTVDHAEDLRQRSAAFEHQAAGELGLEKDAKQPAHPEIFLKDHRRHVPPDRRLLDI